MFNLHLHNARNYWIYARSREHLQPAGLVSLQHNRRCVSQHRHPPASSLLPSDAVAYAVLLWNGEWVCRASCLPSSALWHQSHSSSSERVANAWLVSSHKESQAALSISRCSPGPKRKMSPAVFLGFHQAALSVWGEHRHNLLSTVQEEILSWFKGFTFDGRVSWNSPLPLDSYS